ncbi:hypothetical protein DFH08DRAFT_94849 [Mycena albidolilacea]|uniref:Uncharacterized protein n=1 Tax=Mycena albidolilacea TaxID=1033008 RepID=A0AAD7E7G7_9AGAR|nr:hypothetical protein DFH08DRAFT_94849 [Mycena albidolilacea]
MRYHTPLPILTTKPRPSSTSRLCASSATRSSNSPGPTSTSPTIQTSVACPPSLGEVCTISLSCTLSSSTASPCGSSRPSSPSARRPTWTDCASSATTKAPSWTTSPTASPKRTSRASHHPLHLVFSPEDRYDTEPLWAKPDRCDHVKRLGEDYHACGIRLAIFAANRGSAFPPYLFGEETPCEKPAYRAENVVLAWNDVGGTFW